jgi:Leucine-rich repeat (LRR) protein
VESGTFRQLSSLSELHLESNLIASILPGTFWGNPLLVVLNLRHNSLSSLPVDIITLKNHIQELDISDNSIKKVDTYLVQRYYPELRILDVSRNKITRIFSTSPVDKSTLEIIDASFNYIAELDPSTFSSASKLSEVNISNNEISNLSEDMFASNPELVKLDISNNHILAIHRDAFRNNPKITEIYAGSNSLTYLHPGTFYENPQLTKVIVSWNKIQDIHPQTFYNNPNLEYLDFNGNKLKTLSPDVFHNNPRLKSVDLRSNSLVTIHETTFQNNPELEHLLVSRNEHIRFHDGLLIFASSLKVFDAQHCNLTQVSADLLKNATDLRELHLGNNNLTSLDCVTDTDSDDYVDSLTKLQVLDLSNNQLQTINVEVITNKMTDLKTLRIEGNPFLCDCKLRNVWLWSQKVGIIPSQPQITCTDIQQRTVPWDDMQHLNCSDESLTEESTSTVTFTHTEESTSKVRGTHTEKSTYTVTGTYTSLKTGLQHLTSGDKSRTEGSTSTLSGTVTSMHSEPQRIEWSESSGIPERSVPKMDDIRKLVRKDEAVSNTILISASIFLILAIALLVFSLLFFMRRRYYGLYKVSKEKGKMENNNNA